MRHRVLASLGVVVAVILLVSLAPDAVAGQGPSGAATADKVSTPPRTPWGHPDLQGVWDYRTITPLERPDELGGKQVLTEQEIAEYERQQAEVRNRDRRDGTPQADVQRAYNHFWWDFGTKVVGTNRTSLIVDPPDGKIPPLTPDAQKRAEARRGLATNNAREEGGAGRGFDSYENRPLAERCILWRTAGPPMMPGPYNNNVQLFQTPDYVVIFNEMVHENRMVPLDGRPHISQGIRQLLGDSRGRWEGNTLVVETTNFTDKSAFQGSTQNMHLIERFSLVVPDTLLYEFTVNDSATFTRAWTAQVTMARSPEPIYEYACHEGNYAMRHGLEGARNLEKAAAEAVRKGSR